MIVVLRPIYMRIRDNSSLRDFHYCKLTLNDNFDIHIHSMPFKCKQYAVLNEGVTSSLRSEIWLHQQFKDNCNYQNMR